MNEKIWIYSSSQPTGINIQAFIRDTLMVELNLPIQQAQKIADKMAERFNDQTWLELSNGRTFTLPSFVRRAYS